MKTHTVEEVRALAKPKRGKRTPESIVKAACSLILSAHGIFWWNNSTTGIYDPSSSKFRTNKGQRGVSDLLGILPQQSYSVGGVRSVAQGRFLAVEVKAGKNKMTADQERFLQNVNDAGGLGLCVWSALELHEALNREGY